MTTEIDLKIVARVQKLLRLSKDKGATEAEASLAAARAAEIMEEYGLSTATIEAEGGEGESREKTVKSSAFGAWYEPLLAAVAESCFCYAATEEERVGPFKTRRLFFTLIGRKSAVASANVMYEYLRETIWRLSREANVDSERHFRHGCAERVIQRLHRRHAEVLLRQEQEAEYKQREQAARAAHPGAAPTGTALVITLVDYAQRERDLNEDFRRGVPPGTTEQERRDEKAKAAAQKVEFDRLRAEGVDKEVAWDVVYLGWARDKAEEYEAAARRRAAEAAAEEARRAQRRGHKSANYQYRETREDKKRRSPSFQAGRAAGEHVGLDQQIGRTDTKKIGGAR